MNLIPSSLGVSVSCERATAPVDMPARCLHCDEPFLIEAAWIVVRAGTERLGLIGPCCLAPCARERFAEECRRYA